MQLLGLGPWVRPLPPPFPSQACPIRSRTSVPCTASQVRSSPVGLVTPVPMHSCPQLGGGQGALLFWLVVGVSHQCTAHLDRIAFEATGALHFVIWRRDGVFSLDWRFPDRLYGFPRVVREGRLVVDWWVFFCGRDGRSPPGFSLPSTCSQCDWKGVFMCRDHRGIFFFCHQQHRLCIAARNCVTTATTVIIQFAYTATIAEKQQQLCCGTSAVAH